MSQSTPFAGNLRGAVDLTALANRAAAPSGNAAGSSAASASVAEGAPADGGPISVPSLVFEGTDANFERFIQLSNHVPVIVDLWADWCEPCKQLSPILDRVVTAYDGRFILVKVDVDANPQLSQAFQAQSIPTVAGIVAGRPISLFVGALPEPQVRDVFAQVLELAAQNGVTGTVHLEGGAEAPEEESEPEPEPLPPHHQEAFDAIDRGDFDGAIQEYTTAIAQNPRDSMAVAGLAQVKLLKRLSSVSAADLRSSAAADPDDVEAQLAVADLDISGGHLADAFDRLLSLFPSLDASGKDEVRGRLLDYFEIAGSDHPDVRRARARLTGLLY